MTNAWHATAFHRSPLLGRIAGMLSELRTPGDWGSETANLPASTLGLPAEQMRAAVEQASHANYRAFKIPKRRGGHRTIQAPGKDLMAIQQGLVRRLAGKLPSHPAAHGFVAERSIVSHARPHLGRRWVLALDLEDFFGSTTQLHIFDALARHVPSMPKHDALALAWIATLPERVRTRPSDGPTLLKWKISRLHFALEARSDEGLTARRARASADFSTAGQPAGMTGDPVELRDSALLSQPGQRGELARQLLAVGLDPGLARGTCSRDEFHQRVNRLRPARPRSARGRPRHHRWEETWPGRWLEPAGPDPDTGQPFDWKKDVRVLPQGAPTSPMLANLVLHDLDTALAAFAGSHDLTYTRYADDLVFSGDRSPREHLPSLHRLVEEHAFVLRRDKTRIMGPKRRHVITGLVVDQTLRPTPPRPRVEGRSPRRGMRTVRLLRAVLHRLDRDPDPDARVPWPGREPVSRMQVAGYLSYLRMIDPDCWARLVSRSTWARSLNGGTPDANAPPVVEE